jgi:hypothetical protein
MVARKVFWIELDQIWPHKNIFSGKYFGLLAGFG